MLDRCEKNVGWWIYSTAKLPNKAGQRQAKAESGRCWSRLVQKCITKFMFFSFLFLPLEYFQVKAPLQCRVAEAISQCISTILFAAFLPLWAFCSGAELGARFEQCKPYPPALPLTMAALSSAAKRLFACQRRAWIQKRPFAPCSVLFANKARRCSIA